MQKRIRSKKASLLILLMFVLVLAACGGQGVGNEADGEKSPEEDGIGSEEVKLVLNWFPKSQHGGVYAAEEKGIFAENGLDVSIEPGGPQVSAIQIVSSGSAEFGLVHADQMVIAKNQGIDLVAVAAAMQGSPQAFVFHKGTGIEDFEDLNGRSVFIQPGITYWEFLKSKFDLSEVQEMVYNGQYATFINDPEAVSQSFVTSEPFMLENQGIENETKLISESGYDPYNVVLFVTRDYLEENKDTVQKMVTSFVKGWDAYKDSSEEINKGINKLNPDLSLESLAFETETQAEFIYGREAEENGVGYMTEERWTTLKDQLLALDLLEEDFDVSEIFTTEFLPN
jgi:NitT/TauT family transport system substrate-binding protein